MSSSKPSPGWQLLAALAVPMILSAAIALFKRGQRKQSKALVKKGSFQSTTFTVIEENATTGSLETSQQVMGTWTALGLEQAVVIAMVGLPARGKSYLVKMMIRYLKWNGFEADVFNVGSYRRKIGHQSADSTFFSSANPNAKKIREEMAMAVQDFMYSWLHESDDARGRVAVFDATNTTRARRLALARRAKKENVYLLFVESICDDEKTLQRNYDLKLQNDDYKGMDPVQAKLDFLSRVQAYEKVYETIEDDEDNHQVSYVKLINVGQKVITRNCTGYLPSQVAFYLQNVHILPRRIYLTLNAENLDFVEDNGRLGGAESGRLTASGAAYSLDLAKYIYARQENMQDLGKDMLVLAGTAKVHEETMLHLRTLYTCYNTPLLNELRGGDLHGLSKDVIQKEYPEEARKRGEDKLRYRYPGVGGESYLDVIERIRPVIIELERQRRSVLVICHMAVLRCIYAYFMGSSIEDIPFLPFRRHCVYELSPGPFGCTCQELSPTEELNHM